MPKVVWKVIGMIQKPASLLISAIFLMLVLEVPSHAKLAVLNALMQLHVPFVIMDLSLILIAV